MKYLTKSARIRAIFAAAAGLGCFSAAPAHAFTVKESLFLTSVQMQASQPIDLFIKVSNVSAAKVDLVLIAYNEKGQIVKTAGTTAAPITVAPKATFSFSLSAPTTGTKNFHAIVNLDTLNAVVADLVTIDSTTGQQIAIEPAKSTLPAKQLIGTVELAPKQSAKVELSNATGSSVGAALEIVDDAGKVLKSFKVTIPANATNILTLTASATSSLGFHTIVTWSAPHLGGADVVVLDSSGNTLAALPFE
jgi:hypothetical protein